MSSVNPTDPPGLKKGLIIFYIVCALLLVVDFIPVFHHAEGTEAAWKIPQGFYGIYGFVACVILVVAAKGLRKIVMRAENYYDKH